MTSKQKSNHQFYIPAFPNKCIEKNVYKSENKTEDVKCKNLDTSENKKTSTHRFERKVPNKLIPIIQQTSQSNRTRKGSSKIPVLQKSQLLYKNEYFHKTVFDINMSAADRRQKFQQSRQYVSPQHAFAIEEKKFNQSCQHIAPKYAICSTPVGLQPIEICKEFPSLYDTKVLNKVKEVILPSTQHKKILPPIKNINSDVEKSMTRPKKKCLLGEITHFPTLCNIFPKPMKKIVVSSVPHLPSIYPPPAAPPPSVSNSLEKDGSLKQIL